MLSLVDKNYTRAEKKEIEEMGLTRDDGRYPLRAWYRKVANEVGPTWAEKKEFVQQLAHTSLISPMGQTKLREAQEIIPHY